jgi:hypothetical protein
VVFRCTISHAYTLALQDAEPLFDVVHP